MHVEMSGGAFDGITWIAFAIAALGFVSSLFWMVVGWRAMRAHERIANDLRSLAEHLNPQRQR